MFLLHTKHYLLLDSLWNKSIVIDLFGWTGRSWPGTRSPPPSWSQAKHSSSSWALFKLLITGFYANAADRNCDKNKIWIFPKRICDIHWDTWAQAGKIGDESGYTVRAKPCVICQIANMKCSMYLYLSEKSNPRHISIYIWNTFWLYTFKNILSEYETMIRKYSVV